MKFNNLKRGDLIFPLEPIDFLRPGSEAGEGGWRSVFKLPDLSPIVFLGKRSENGFYGQFITAKGVAWAWDLDVIVLT